MNEAFKQMWLDEFNGACEIANKNKKESGSDRWTENDKGEVDFCRAKYQSYLFNNPIRNEFTNYDRFCNYMQKNY